MTYRVAAVQMVSGGDLSVNLDSAAQLISQAKEEGAELVLLPEVFAVLEGGPMRPFAEKQGSGPIQGFLAEQARLHQLMIVGGHPSLLSLDPRKQLAVTFSLSKTTGCDLPVLYITRRGEMIARYDKMHLFDVSVNDAQSNYSESRSYEPGDEIVCVDSELGKLGLSVCYDLRFPEFYRELFRLGAEIVTVPAAFTRLTGEAHWEVCAAGKSNREPMLHNCSWAGWST